MLTKKTKQNRRIIKMICRQVNLRNQFQSIAFPNKAETLQIIICKGTYLHLTDDTRFWLSDTIIRVMRSVHTMFIEDINNITILQETTFHI